ncbi:hypothetical protein EDB86DRAFT_2939958 [Lactarius hatsudake]|nr:hypothetical protein EDB86DRAFT_2939958 [Lactarius hatsudake]
MRLDQTDTHMNVFDVEMTSKSILHVCMKNLWHFTYSEQGNSVSLPPYICIAFTNPEMTRRIYQDADLATQVIGRCIGALVVNKVAANFNSRGDLASDVEPACLSAILGTEDHNVKLLLSHRGSIELTNMVFLALDDTYFINESVPPDVPDVVQRTLGVLSRALPHDLGAKLRQDWSDSLTQVSDGGSSLRAKIHKRVSRMCLKALWHFTGDFVPLPSYICIAFSNPEMTRRIRERDPATRVMGRCIGALIITRLTAALKSKSAAPLAGDWEHACLSAILGTEGRDVGHYLSQPGTIELLSMASLAFSDVSSSLWAKEVLPDARDVLQQTLRILSKALPTQESLKLHEFHTDALNNISDNRFEHTIVSRLHALLRMCIPGASPLTEEVRSSCLWMTLKILWHCGTAYHQTSDPLPPYFHLVLASPEITRHFHSEQDPVLRMMGCCLRALIASKLVNSLPPKLTISLSGGGHHATHNAILACISAILGKGHRDVLLPYQLRIINFRNVVSLMSDEIDTLFTPAGMPADVLDIAEQTLNILVERFHATSWFIPGDLPMDQRQLLGKIYSTVMDSRRPNSLKETVQTLNQLQQVLEKLLPTVE